MGKYSKKARPCPALEGRPIKPAECGARRGTELECPAACAYNPFGLANYEALMKVEGEWMAAAVRRLMERWGKAVFQRRLREATLPMRNPDLELDYGVHNVVHWGLLFHRDAEGRTEADHWEAEGWPGLNNDGRALARYARRTRPAVIEVRRRVDDSVCECVDLLHPETPPLRVYDRALAGAAAPFAVLLIWLASYPHCHRALGVAMELPPDLWEPLRERLEARHAELRRERPELDFTTFFAEHMRWAGEEAARLRHAKDHPPLPRIFQARFALRAPAEKLAERLAAEADFQPATETETAGAGVEASRLLDWRPSAGPGAPAEDAEAGELIQTVQLNAEGLLIACLQPEIRAALRQRVEQVLGADIVFQEEREVDLTEAMAAQQQEAELVETAQRTIFAEEEKPNPAADAEAELDEAGVDALLREQYRRALDEPVERWGGKTLRAAARDEALRPQVTRTVKTLLHQAGQWNRRHGWSLNLDWLLDELGLDELK